MIEGIDVSNAGQGMAFNWDDAHAAGVTFAYIKASQGTYFRDPAFVRNRAQAKSRGIIAGPYHYWDPTVDAVTQARYFAATCGAWQPGDLPPALDVELDDWLHDGSHLTPAQLTAHALLCLQEIERQTGRRPMFYTYPDFFRHRFGNTALLSNYPLWLAAYPDLPVPMLGAWKLPVIHQYADNGYIGPANRRTKVDLDRFLGTQQEFKEFCGMDTPLILTPSTHPVTGAFKAFYQSEPKAMQYFGLPITDARQEKLGDGNTYTVQYFERARFELHANNQVQLGLVGAELLATRP